MYQYHKLAAVASAVVLVSLGLVADKRSDRHQVIPMTQEKWTASESPYITVLNKMVADYKSGMTPQDITKQFKAEALSHPNDPVAQLAWVAAERGEREVATGTSDMPPSLLQQLEQADPGNVHQYTRYRYCLSEEVGSQLPVTEVITVGNRLLQYNPHDEWVRTSMIYMLVNTEQEFPFALSRAQEWVKQSPKNPKAHSTLALVYEDIWAADRANHRAEAAKSVAEYRAYLSLAPPSDPFRQNAEYLIRTISHDAHLSAG